MTYEAVEVNYRNLIDIIEAVYVLEDRAILENITSYADITEEIATKSLKMAIQLKFLEKRNDHYVPIIPYARLLTNAKMKGKKAILKFKLMEFQPFKFFTMAILKGENVTRAAYKTKQAFEISGSATILAHTFLDLGIFVDVFINTDSGIEAVFKSESELLTIFESIGTTINEESEVESFIGTQLDSAVSDYIDEFKSRLVTSGQIINSNPENSIKTAADVFEDFLKKIATEEGVDLTGANGIILVGDRLKTNNKITTKHLGYISFIGKIRNAFKHTTDVEINASWISSRELTFIYFLTVLAAINSIYLFIKKNEYIL
ncbi:MAG: hypothetical protein ACTSQY_09285 [Candidatus Odinarchaeia archaeon]